MMVHETLLGEAGTVFKTEAEMSNAELLSAVLGVAEGRLQYENLTDIMHAPTSVRGIGEKKAAKLFALRELARRLMSVSPKIDVIHGPEDVAHFAMPKYRYEDKEHFAIVVLNTKNHILAMPDISIGSLTASVVHPREVFREALKYPVASIILLHNHPSGDPSPSREDIAVTKRLVKAGEILDIPVLDHVIIGNNRFVSLKEKGLLN